MTTIETTTTFPPPGWATTTREPKDGDFGMHSATIAVRNGAHQVIGTIELNQIVCPDGSLEPLLCDPDDWTDLDAQGCRDLAAALLKAAQVIDNA